ncbi:MAG: plasmid pRiA4b ORF-3 family protein, partial [Anaerolineales bacterium]|nr:plasmid pRiA4b ORF-3 family protein [Anaerolineales bacterium]
YEYDFGDGWEHIILLEKILPFDPQQDYPICIKGKRACPPEDVGGVWGYEYFIETQDPQHPEHERYIEWYGEPFDSEVFDIDKINKKLRKH